LKETLQKCVLNLKSFFFVSMGKLFEDSGKYDLPSICFQKQQNIAFEFLLNFKYSKTHSGSNDGPIRTKKGNK